MKNPIGKATAKALSYLENSPGTVYSTQEQALILILSNAPRVDSIRLQHDKTARIIAKQLEGSWSQHASLSDLCTNFAALHKYNKKIVTGKHFATLAARLIKAEAAPGGPYYNGTQLDLETNIMVAYVFHLLAKPLPKVENFIKSQLKIVWGISPLAHYACRAMDLSPLPQLSSSLFGRMLQEYGPPARNKTNLIATLLHTQQPDGSWRDTSGVVTSQTATLLALELLNPSSSDPPINHDPRHNEQLGEVRGEIEFISLHLRPLAVTVLEEIERLDTTEEVVLMPYFFADQFPQLSQATVAHASRANIYCWMAYILYDRLLDGEQTPPESLPLMAFAMRRSHALYSQLAPTLRALQLVESSFNTMDSTNAWEVRHTRLAQEGSDIKIETLPYYGLRQPLASRSLGHILGPQLLAYHLNASRRQHRTLQQGLHHFLVARQLHDDIHDWVDDLRSGQASFVVTFLLRKIGIKPGTYSDDVLISQMRAEFWRRSLGEINALTLRHAQLSKELLAKSRLVSPSSRLAALVDTLQKATLQANTEHEKYHTFLHEFVESR